VISDLAAIEARLREREAALKSGALSETDLRALAEEGAEILQQLREIRAGILPALGQAEALLRQLEAEATLPSPRLDFHG
jgi:hypothetical protein